MTEHSGPSGPTWIPGMASAESRLGCTGKGTICSSLSTMSAGGEPPSTRRERSIARSVLWVRDGRKLRGMRCKERHGMPSGRLRDESLRNVESIAGSFQNSPAASQALLTFEQHAQRRLIPSPLRIDVPHPTIPAPITEQLAATGRVYARQHGLQRWHQLFPARRNSSTRRRGSSDDRATGPPL